MRKTPSFLPQLEENQKILPSKRVEALFCCGIKRYIQPSLLSLERVLDTLEATQEVPQHTVSFLEEHQWSHHNSRRALVFPPHLELRVCFPASSGKESRRFHRISRGGSLNFNFERNSRGRATILRDPDVPIHSKYNSLPYTDSTVTPRIDSKLDGRCDSPVAPREKATDPYVKETGTLTLFFQLENRAD